MLVWHMSYYKCLTLFHNTLQINDLDEPADMFFSLTESPWIRAGRQYSVRVCHLYSFRQFR